MPDRKRHLVLYAILASGVILIAVLGWINMSSYLSFMEQKQEEKAASSTPATTSPSPTTTPVAVPAPVPFEYEIVASPATQARGLSGRAEIPANYGMLFVFTRPDYHGIWMKDMLVPIDILWLSDSGRVVHLEENAWPDSYPTVFNSPAPSTYVLETKAGEAKRQGWTVGTKIDLPLPYGR